MMRSFFLLDIFDTQDKALRKSLRNQHIAEQVLFINNCLKFLAETDINKKYHAMHFILNDISTVIIVSTRLGLCGCFAEACALSRVALENLAVLDYVVQERKFSVLNEAMKRGLKKTKIDYRAIQHKVDPKIKKLHNELSLYCSHTTNKRILASGSHHFGVDCIGISLNRDKIDIALSHLCNMSIFSTRVLRAYFEKSENGSSKFIDQQDELERFYSLID